MSLFPRVVLGRLRCRIWYRGLSSEKSFQLDALKFTVSPNAVYDKFQIWAKDEQGIDRLIRKDIKLLACYVPVWSFDLNLRFKSPNGSFTTKPAPFEIYKSSVVYVPGLAAYAGYNYRRSLVDPIHNTSLVFLGQDVIKFQNYLLEDMVLTFSNNNNYNNNKQYPQRISIDVDPWNASRGRALEVVLENLQNLAKKEDELQVQAQVVQSRRVYMPTYIIEYNLLGVTYQAFISGCDAASSVSAMNHAVGIGLPKVDSTFLQQGMKLAQRIGGPMGLVWLLQALGSFALRILSRVPLLAVLGAAFVAVRKVIQPYYHHTTSRAEWERQRNHERHRAENRIKDDFTDWNYSGRRYFEQHRKAILSHLSGETKHHEGDFTWYQQWEQWAREQVNEQQQQQQQNYGQQQQQYTSQQQRQRQQQQYNSQQRQQKQQQQQQTKSYNWNFDPKDPYQVLEVPRGASKDEISRAFRREMLKHHPDTQSASSQEEKDRATERSKLITAAYQSLKKQIK